MPEPTREAIVVEGVRGAGEQHGQPVRFLDQLPALGWHGIHDAVEHRRLHPDLATRAGWELQGFLDSPLDTLDKVIGAAAGTAHPVGPGTELRGSCEWGGLCSAA